MLKMKLTKKQNEIVNLVQNKQKELYKTVYIMYIQEIKKMCIIDIINLDEEKEKFTFNVIVEVNTRSVYSMLEKGILISKTIYNNFSLPMLNLNVI